MIGGTFARLPEDLDILALRIHAKCDGQNYPSRWFGILLINSTANLVGGIG